MTDLNRVQTELKIPLTELLDDFTSAAIRNFELKNGIPPTGVVHEVLMEKLKIDTDDSFLDTDFRSKFLAASVQSVKQYQLPKSEYFVGPTTKDNIFLHFTMGWGNPYDVIDGWKTDTRGKIGTHYVIGGINIKTGDDEHDGEIVQAIPETGYAWHIGIGNTPVHRNSISIEVCNFGFITKKGDKFYTYLNREIDKKYVVELKTSFRGYKYYHKVTDKQIQSLAYLINKITVQHGISITSGIVDKLKRLPPNDAFDYDANVKNGKIKGIHTHTNVSPAVNGEYAKWDLAPTPEVIKFLTELK